MDQTHRAAAGEGIFYPELLAVGKGAECEDQQRIHRGMLLAQFGDDQLIFFVFLQFCLQEFQIL